MVRSYILTEHERKILERFIKEGERLNGITTLMTYLRKSHHLLTKDMQLINEALEKYSQK
ncbi:MAG: hypothetical protein QXX34_06920 [Candidatus Bathyarchaeia archaeon]